MLKSFPALVLLVWGLSASHLIADAIMVTRAMSASTIVEIFIEPDEIGAELEIGLNDLGAFANLLPDPIHDKLGIEPEPLETRLPQFFGEDFVIRADGGEALWGRVEEMTVRPRIRRDPITGDPLPLSPEDEQEIVVFARIRYPFVGRPATLSFSPPQSASEFAAAEIGFQVYHRGLPVNDFRYFGSTETLNLDWEDPWYSRFDNRNLRRQFDAPLSAYLYIEPYEIRKEIVLRPKDLQEWVDLGLEGKEVIAAAEWDDIKGRVVAFLEDRNRVLVDGKPVRGFLDRIHFIRRSLRTTGVIDTPVDLPVISATLGVIFVYPIDGLPQEATMEWELFNERIRKVPSMATDEAGGLPYFLVPDDAVLRWQNFLKNPTIPRLVAVQPPKGANLWLTGWAVLAGAGLLVLMARHGRGIVAGRLPSKRMIALTAVLAFIVAISLPLAIRSRRVSDAEAGAIVAGLLENIYRAFDYREEERIYDTLERSASGDLLTDIYLETRRSLEIENQGGARAKVQSVEMLQVEAEPIGGEPGFVTECTWNVSGSVGHWGHIHQRTNQYVARLTVRAIDGAWKVTDLELLQEERL
jgi:hypothetical protein